jgi:hypothetical protein
MTKSAPRRTFEHDDHRIPTAGGVRSDSAAGTEAAVEHGHVWIDKDGQLMHRTRAGIKKGRRDRHVVWVNAHGAPFLPDWLRRLRRPRFTAHALPEVPAGDGLQTARETFADCKAHDRKVEWEVKDLRPFTSQAALDNALQLLAEDARAVWGDEWQQHVVVKVLNTLRGGLRYALKVCKAAHRAGFDSMLLNHRKRPVVIGPVRAKYVTYVRGDWRKRLSRKVER